MMKIRISNPFLIFWILVSTVVVFLSVVGGFRSFSPVPSWDMWHGYIGFYINSSNPAAWWAQHNEHRILLSRILMWVDLYAFGGKSIFLVLTNYIFLGITAWIIIKIYLDLNKTSSSQVKLYVVFGILAWIFLWLQRANLVNGFQTCFFIVNFMALSSFYWMHKASDDNEIKSFIISCIFGVGALYALASGVLVMPLIVLYAVIMRMGYTKILLALTVTIVSTAIYLYGYISPPYHGHLVSELLGNPAGYLEYVLLFLGAPFYFILGGGQIGLSGGSIGSIVAIIAGSTISSGALYALCDEITRKKKNSLRISLILFIAFIILGAVLTAGGRLNFGANQALSLRYETPVILAWACFAILIATYIGESDKSHNYGFHIPGFSFLILVLIYQLSALNIPNLKHDYAVSALALELQANDVDQLKILYRDPAILLNLAQRAKSERLSIFSSSPLLGAQDSIGTISGIKSSMSCPGSVDVISLVSSDHRYYKISGWIFDSKEKSMPTFLTVTDPNGYILGYAITGKKRPDVAKAINPAAMYSGFDGYISVANIKGNRIVVNAGNVCALTRGIR